MDDLFPDTSEADISGYDGVPDAQNAMFSTREDSRPDSTPDWAEPRQPDYLDVEPDADDN